LASLFLDVYVHGKKQETWGKLFFITWQEAKWKELYY
jgi:hypothetical protein